MRSKVFSFSGCNVTKLISSLGKVTNTWKLACGWHYFFVSLTLWGGCHSKAIIHFKAQGHMALWPQTNLW